MMVVVVVTMEDAGYKEQENRTRKLPLANVPSSVSSVSHGSSKQDDAVSAIRYTLRRVLCSNKLLSAVRSRRWLMVIAVVAIKAFGEH